MMRRALGASVVLPSLCWLLGCGGSSPAGPAETPTPAPTPSTATLAELSAAVSSREAGRTLNCREDVTAQITLTNRSASAVVVTGVVHSSIGVSGGCEGVPDFTFRPSVTFVGPGQTLTIFDRGLYGGASGCCSPGSPCDGRSTCGIEESFKVETLPGVVAAGAFRYQVNFRECEACSDLLSAEKRACRVLGR
jgi:hypothetical protein